MNSFVRWMTIAIAGAACASFAFAQDTGAPGPLEEGLAVAGVTQTQIGQGCSSAVFDREELLNRREVQLASYELYRETRAFPRVNSMWVTFKDGKFGFIRWENTQTMNEAFWTGPLPQCAVAIIHTHPAGRSKEPCFVDHQLANGKQASGIRVPVYVLHHRSISKLMPGSSRAVTVRETGWMNEFAPLNGEPSGLIALNAEQ